MYMVIICKTKEALVWIDREGVAAADAFIGEILPSAEEAAALRDAYIHDHYGRAISDFKIINLLLVK